MADLMSDDRMEAEYGQSSVRALPPEQAAALAQQGATLLLLGVPQGTQIAINFHTFTAVRSLGDGHTKPALSPSPISPLRPSLSPQRSPVQPRPRLTRVSGAVWCRLATAQGPKFSGLKMIPPGLHFLSHTAVAKDSSTSPIKAGFWFRCAPLRIG